MSFKSILKPDSSVMTGAACAAVILTIYQKNVPNMADVRTANPHNTDIEASRKRAAWESFAFLSVIFLLTRDMGVYIVGGTVLAVTDFHVKHANGVEPSTGKLQPHGANLQLAAPAADYGQTSGGDYTGVTQAGWDESYAS